MLVVLALLRRRPQQARDSLVSPDRHHDRHCVAHLSHCDRQVVSVPTIIYPGLRLRMARAFFGREEQAGDVQISSLVVHGRLQDDRVDANET